MPKTEAASWVGRRAGRLQPAPREKKMLRPVCLTCEAGDNVPKDWYKTCDHDPYVTVVERTERRPIYETDENGTMRITNTETIVHRSARPNWVSISLTKGINSGIGLNKARRKGYILPTELRSPVYPNGIKERCEFRDCYAEDIHPTQQGMFCRDLEAKLVWFSEGKGRVFEVFDSERQRDQLTAAERIV